MSKTNTILVILVGVCVVLAMWYRGRGKTVRVSETTRNVGRKLTEVEIHELLKTIPAAKLAGAQEIQMRLSNQDKSVCRKIALELLATLDSPPVEDYWTLRVLAEIAGHPIPDKQAAAIIQHFNRMEKDREMLGPALVLIGTEAAGRVLIKAEEAAEGRYFTRVVYPLEEAAKRDRLDAGFRVELSKHLATRAEKDAKQFTKKNLVQLWMAVDPQAAVERITREPFWNPVFEGHWDVLQCLVRNAVKVPEEKLLAFDEMVKVRAATDDKVRHPNSDVVWLLARIHSKRADTLIGLLKQNPDSAAEALAAEGALQGIIQPRAIVRQHLENPGYANSPAPIRHLWALELLHMELVNGGMHQYFFNSSGDLWPDALDGLEHAGFKQSAEALRNAIAIFGKDGPSTNRTTRFAQLDRLSKTKLGELERMGDQAYKGFSETNTWAYIFSHAEVFRTEPARQAIQ